MANTKKTTANATAKKTTVAPSKKVNVNEAKTAIENVNTSVGELEIKPVEEYLKNDKELNTILTELQTISDKKEELNEKIQNNVDVAEEEVKKELERVEEVQKETEKIMAAARKEELPPRFTSYWNGMKQL